MRVLVLALAGVLGCGGVTSKSDTGPGGTVSDEGIPLGDDPGTGDDSGATDDTGRGDDTAAPDDTGEPVEPGPDGFIGSPCDTDGDCLYEGGVCLKEGLPDGMCSSACDLYCPDADGHPTTFCVDGAEIGAGSLDGGWCVSRCDFGIFPSMGCREDYGCRIESRHDEPWTETYACMPGDDTDLSSCHYELADRGIAFEPTVRNVDHPEGHPDIDCVIEDPVWILSPVFGVDLKYYDGSETPRTLAACELAHAVGDTIEDVVDQGVTSLLHIGTYNCRVIGGTDTVSRHGFADAIDIYGFEFEAGHTWTLVDDWEHETDSPTTDAGTFLYEAAYRWYDDWIWNIILTPNYNTDHDNHFHVDLSPDSHYVGFTDGRFIGPAPYAD